MGKSEQKEDQPFVVRIGPLVVDVPDAESVVRPQWVEGAAHQGR